MCDLCLQTTDHLPGCPNDSFTCPACGSDPNEDCDLCDGSGMVDERTARFWCEAQRELEIGNE